MGCHKARKGGAFVVKLDFEKWENFIGADCQYLHILHQVRVLLSPSEICQTRGGTKLYIDTNKPRPPTSSSILTFLISKHYRVRFVIRAESEVSERSNPLTGSISSKPINCRCHEFPSGCSLFAVWGGQSSLSSLFLVINIQNWNHWIWFNQCYCWLAGYKL